MKNITKILAFAMMAGMVSCSKPQANDTTQNSPLPLQYENELFSINLPKGWTYDDSNWEGLTEVRNEVDFYHPSGSIVWLRCVKSFYPFEWESIKEAKEMAIAARGISGDNVELLDETDSIEVGGYPASILCFANYLEHDTIIQKQFVVYLEESRIVMYFNEIFNIKDWGKAQNLGDRIIRSVKLKKIKNPLEDKLTLQQAIEGMEEKVDERYLKKAQEIIDRK